MAVAGEVLVDSSAWISFYEGGPMASRVAAQAGKRRLVISMVSVAELHSLSVQARIPRHAVDDLPTLARVEPIHLEDAVYGGRLHGAQRVKGRRKFSLVDGLILSAARRLGISVLTLDRDLQGEPNVEFLA